MGSIVVLVGMVLHSLHVLVLNAVLVLCTILQWMNVRTSYVVTTASTLWDHITASARTDWCWILKDIIVLVSHFMVYIV